MYEHHFKLLHPNYNIEKLIDNLENIKLKYKTSILNTHELKLFEIISNLPEDFASATIVDKLPKYISYAGGKYMGTHLKLDSSLSVINYITDLYYKSKLKLLDKLDKLDKSYILDLILPFLNNYTYIYLLSHLYIVRDNRMSLWLQPWIDIYPDYYGGYHEAYDTCEPYHATFSYWCQRLLKFWKLYQPLVELYNCKSIEYTIIDLDPQSSEHKILLRNLIIKYMDNLNTIMLDTNKLDYNIIYNFTNKIDNTTFLLLCKEIFSVVELTPLNILDNPDGY